MKKTLIALAVLASSGAAMAQSTFTLYGVADASVERQKGGTNSISKLSSGGLQGSRFGLRGSEDLGGGLKGVFTLEAGINIDDGTTAQSIAASRKGSNTAQYNSVTSADSQSPSATSRLFSRQAFLGLEGNFGAVRLGRQYTPIGNVADLVGTKPYDVLTVAGVLAANDVYRSDNSLSYKTPSFSGFTVEGQYSFGLNGNEVADAGKNKSGRNFGLNAIFANGPFTAAIGAVQIQDANYIQSSEQKRHEYLMVLGYDFGVAKLTGYYSQTEILSLDATSGNTTKQADNMKVAGVQAAFPFGAFTVTPGFAMAKDVAGSNAPAKDDAKFFTLQVQYDLSKRTAVYSNLTAVSNDAAASKGFNAPAADKNSNGIQVGVRHRF